MALVSRFSRCELILVAMLACVGFGTPPSSAQSIAQAVIEFGSITSGANSTSGGDFSNSASLGQPIVARSLGVNGVLASGFWQSFYVVDGSPMPLLGLSCLRGASELECVYQTSQFGSVGSLPISLTCTSVSRPDLEVVVTSSVSPVRVGGFTRSQPVVCTAALQNGVGFSNEITTNSQIPTPTLARLGGIDSNGDGVAEALFRSAGVGALPTLISIEFDRSGQINERRLIDDPGSNWRVLGVGDVFSIGRSVLLFQNVLTGEVFLSRSLEGQIAFEPSLRSVKPGWVVESISDIDGDGYSDVVWRYVGSPENPPTNPDDVGVVFVWYLNSSGIREVVKRGGAPLNWSLVGGGDLSGLGRSELVWVSPAKEIRVLFGKDARSFDNRLVGTVPDGYGLSRIADFTGDGRSDFLFVASDGRLKVREMSGPNAVREIDLPTISAGWSIVAVLDVDRDGIADLLFRTASGELVVWILQREDLGRPLIVSGVGVLPDQYIAIDP